MKALDGARSPAVSCVLRTRSARRGGSRNLSILRSVVSDSGHGDSLSIAAIEVLALGVHWPSEVAAGFAVDVPFVLVASRADRATHGRGAVIPQTEPSGG